MLLWKLKGKKGKKELCVVFGCSKRMFTGSGKRIPQPLYDKDIPLPFHEVQHLMCAHDSK